MGKIYWSEIAQHDLEDIANFIARDAPFYAIEFVENLIHHTRQLIHHLKIG
ncbi:MAG: type II toxin-antitoxin system RelE/ParE family toxin [Spirochaetia bacterium]|nr:type II toxin-antitoxin system RelE/ParE family toxin [Spirochaetia bacterium]